MVSTSGPVCVLDHIADFMRFLSGAESFWFTLNTSYAHCCHLSHRFGLSSHEYETLLVAANLAYHDPKLGFSIKQKEWQAFLEGYHFAFDGLKVEFDLKKLDIEAYIKGYSPTQEKRAKFNVLRLGVRSNVSPIKFEQQKDFLGRTVTTPPLLDGLEMKQQLFKRAIAQYIVLEQQSAETNITMECSIVSRFSSTYE
jgi:hypothetical protein